MSLPATTPGRIDWVAALAAAPEPARAALCGAVVATVPTTVIAVELSPGIADAAARWVVDGSVAVLAALRDLLARDDAPALVVVLTWELGPLAGAERAAADATFEAMRGIVQSATLEHPGDTRFTTVALSEPDAGAGARLLGYLTSAHGGFVAGASFDLREGR